MIPFVLDDTVKTLEHQDNRDRELEYMNSVVKEMEEEQPNLVAWLKKSYMELIAEVIDGNKSVKVDEYTRNFLLYKSFTLAVLALKAVYNQQEIEELEESAF